MINKVWGEARSGTNTTNLNFTTAQNTKPVPRASKNGRNDIKSESAIPKKRPIKKTHIRTKEDLLHTLEIADCAYKINESNAKAKQRAAAIQNFFNGNLHKFGSSSEKGKSGFFAYKEAKCWISYRGTETKENIKTDLWAVRKSLPFAKGKAHAGFLYGFYASKMDLDQQINAYCDKLLSGGINNQTLNIKKLEQDTFSILKNKKFNDLFDTSNINKLMQLLYENKENEKLANCASKLLRGLHFFGFQKPLETFGKKSLWLLKKLGITTVSQKEFKMLKEKKKALDKKYDNLQTAFQSLKEKIQSSNNLSNQSVALEQTLNEEEKEVLKQIRRHATMQQVNLHITGISMGGALSQIAGLYYATYFNIQSNIQITNFASPRVFNREAGHYYNKILKKQTTRVTNYLYDIVTFFPMAILGYLHVGKMLPIEQKPKIGKKIKLSDLAAGHHTERYKDGLKALIEGKEPHREVTVVKALIGNFIPSINLKMLQEYFGWLINKLSIALKY